jgi:hypothetical protein
MTEPTLEANQALGVIGDATTLQDRAVPWIIRPFIAKFEWRHVPVFVRIRVLVALGFVIAAVTLCAAGHWWGALFFVAAGLDGWVAFELPRWKLASKQRP